MDYRKGIEVHERYNGDVKILYEDRWHRYWLNEEKDENRLPSATNATGMIDKSGPLMYWAIDQALGTFGWVKEKLSPEKVTNEMFALAKKLKVKIEVDERYGKQILPEKLRSEMIKESLKSIQGIKPKDFLAKLDDASKAHNKKKKEAAETGTDVHNWCEKWIKYHINERYLQHGGDENTLPHPEIEYQVLPEMPKDEIRRNGVSAFLGWVKHYDVVFLASEKKVYSKNHKYVGTMDAVAIINGELAVVDFKTSNHLVDEYRFQVTAYLKAEEEEHEYMGIDLYGMNKNKFDCYWLVRVGKDTKKDKDGNEYVEFEVQRYNEPEEDYKAFLGALAVHNRMKTLEKQKGQSYE